MCGAWCVCENCALRSLRAVYCGVVVKCVWCVVSVRSMCCGVYAVMCLCEVCALCSVMCLSCIHCGVSSVLRGVCEI